ncbi:hypothetical protein [Saccharopolyspora rosea]|uniref:Uncharacterized protein n=1 Tax=Saccharopolyspora rosea TaxID=524884 RepID=A0ABW3FZJ7_9PSEU|nr:hypothetical protein [Saccharopolyspora rosea]
MSGPLIGVEVRSRMAGSGIFTSADDPVGDCTVVIFPSIPVGEDRLDV